MTDGGKSFPLQAASDSDLKLNYLSQSPGARSVRSDAPMGVGGYIRIQRRASSCEEVTFRITVVPIYMFLIAF